MSSSPIPNVDHMSHVKCQCPLASIHCNYKTLKRSRWFESISAMKKDGMALLLKQAGDKGKEFLKIKDEAHRTALGLAISQQSDECFDFLLEHISALSEPAKVSTALGSCDQRC